MALSGRAARQVGASDAALEEDVAREHAVLGSAVEDQASGRVSGHVDGFQPGVSEGDDVAVVQEVAQGDGRLF